MPLPVLTSQPGWITGGAFEPARPNARLLTSTLSGSSVSVATLATTSVKFKTVSAGSTLAALSTRLAEPVRLAGSTITGSLAQAIAIIRSAPVTLLSSTGQLVSVSRSASVGVIATVLRLFARMLSSPIGAVASLTRSVGRAVVAPVIILASTTRFVSSVRTAISGVVGQVLELLRTIPSQGTAVDRPVTVVTMTDQRL